MTTEMEDYLFDLNGYLILKGVLDEEVEGAIEVYMKAGDALLFVDCMAHGSARRINPGERRILIYRYGPKWQNFHPSKAMHDRLTPEQRDVVRLVRIDGLKIVEVSERLGKSPDAVKQLMLRGLARLRNDVRESRTLHLPDRPLDFGGDEDV